MSLSHGTARPEHRAASGARGPMSFGCSIKLVESDTE